MKRLRKNLSGNLQRLTFCTARSAPAPGAEKRFMTVDAFATLLLKLRPWTDYLYFHLMGCAIRSLGISSSRGRCGLQGDSLPTAPCWKKKREILVECPGLRKVNISLTPLKQTTFPSPSKRTFPDASPSDRRRRGNFWSCTACGTAAVRNSETRKFLSAMERAFPRHGRAAPGTQIARRVYLNTGDNSTGRIFPPPTAGTRFCHGLRGSGGYTVRRHRCPLLS